MYEPKKPVKWGLRIYDIADVENGYILAMIPYYGAGTNDELCHPEYGFKTRIILQLVDLVTKATKVKGYHVQTDRQYTSIELAQELLNRKINLTETHNPGRRGLPPQIKNGKMNIPLHEVVSFVKASYYHVLTWRDSRVTSMLSTKMGAMMHSHRRILKFSREEVIVKPEMFSFYSAKIGEIDRADHYVSSYQFLQKTLKLWRKLYFFILETAIVNAYLLHKLHAQQKDERIAEDPTFRRGLIYHLVGQVRNPAYGRIIHRISSDEERLDGKLHIIAHRSINRDCAGCRDRRGDDGRKQTKFYCKTCPRNPGLNPKDCFRIYPTKRDFKGHSLQN
ncbi:piggyBac transposable element-derived protein 3-like [Macrobrachium nipponense]|uniref:piggyBac transposable element-derived protein 3-like n=1 Tax=Macrobrachium nipponense TaxID=159736 RepID=UPI0030C87127